MALPTLPVLDQRCLLSCLYLHLGAGYSLFKPRYFTAGSSGQDRDLNGSEQLVQQSSKKSLSSGLFHSGFSCTFGSSDLDLSAISGTQRARHRGELRDPSSMPGSPAILIKL